MTLEEMTKILAERITAEYAFEDERDKYYEHVIKDATANPKRAEVLYTTAFIGEDLDCDVPDDGIEHEIQVYYDLIAMEMHVEVDRKLCSTSCDISKAPEAWLYFDYDLLLADAIDIAEECVSEWYGVEVD